MPSNMKNASQSRLVPFLVLCLVISTIILIPLKIGGYGFLPPDDALRHAAKVISGKNWNDILVLRDDIKMDSHPGWHATLSAIHSITRWNADQLVMFSVIFLFLLFCAIPPLVCKRPEAWPITLLIIMLANPSFIMRLFLGRPYIVTMSAVILLGFLWTRFQNKKIPYRISLLLIFLIAASTWMHCSWHLFALVVFSFFLAREWRAGFRITVCTLIGIAIGAMLTGNPYVFLKQTLLHTVHAFTNNPLQRMLVGEFQPFTGNSIMVIVVIGMLAWRHMRGTWSQKRIDNPVFILAVSAWVLGFVSQRFWLDWGMPAIAVWMVQEFNDALENKMGFFSWQRFLLAMAVAGTLYIGITNDVNGRWTVNLTTEYLSLEEPAHKEWLPEPGGIVYSNEMRIFYDTFYKNPHAPWRYILGFEPTMMPPRDLAIFRKIQWNFGAYEAFKPWVKKMKPEDRLIIKGTKKIPPDIPGLEWHYAATGIWIGRLRGELD